MHQGSGNLSAPTHERHARQALSGFREAIACPLHMRLPPVSEPERDARQPAFSFSRPSEPPRRPSPLRTTQKTARQPWQDGGQPHGRLTLSPELRDGPLVPTQCGPLAPPLNQPGEQSSTPPRVPPRAWPERTSQAPAHAKRRGRGAWVNRLSPPERRQRGGWNEVSSGRGKLDSNPDQISTSILRRRPKPQAAKFQASSRQARPAP